MNKILTLTLSLVMGMASAQEPDLKKETNSLQARPIQVSPKEAKQSGRYGKRISLTLGGNVIRYSKIAGSINFGYFFNKDFMGRISYFNVDEQDDVTSIFDDPEKMDVFEIGLRRYVGKSFYITPHIYHRHYTSFEDVMVSIDYQRKDIGYGITIGNQWNWEFVTFGVNWVGLNVSAIDLREEGVNDNLVAGADITFNFLEFNLGVTF